MKCQRCESTRIVSLCSKASDLHDVRVNGFEHDGYLPDDLGIGGGDYVEMDYCMNCGQIQGQWPLPTSNLERGRDPDSDDDDEFYDDDDEAPTASHNDLLVCHDEKAIFNFNAESNVDQKYLRAGLYKRITKEDALQLKTKGYWIDPKTGIV